jgi:hypothetical protein
MLLLMLRLPGMLIAVLVLVLSATSMRLLAVTLASSSKGGCP